MSSKSKAIFIVISIFLVLLVGAFIISRSRMVTTPTGVNQTSSTFDFASQKIMLDGQRLKEGTGTISNRVVNSSGTKAAAVLISNSGGSGTFYYLIGASIKNGNEIYSTPVLLGDRVKIGSVAVDEAGANDNGLITVEYLDRAKDSPIATSPTVEVTAKYAFQDDGNLIIVKN